MVLTSNINELVCKTVLPLCHRYFTDKVISISTYLVMPEHVVKPVHHQTLKVFIVLIVGLVDSPFDVCYGLNINVRHPHPLLGFYHECSTGPPALSCTVLCRKKILIDIVCIDFIKYTYSYLMKW